MPNWLSGIITWAKGNKAYAIGIALGVPVMAWFLFVPGEAPQVVQQQQEEDRFGAGALPGDATTAKALTEMQVAVESLGFALSQQREQHSRLLRDVESQTSRFNARFQAQERSYTEQLEAALKAAIEIARDTEQRQAAAPGRPQASAPASRLRILPSGRRRGRPGICGSAAPAAATRRRSVGALADRFPGDGRVDDRRLRHQGARRRPARAGGFTQRLFRSERYRDSA